jgi:hypothetical protein
VATTLSPEARHGHIEPFVVSLIISRDITRVIDWGATVAQRG